MPICQPGDIVMLVARDRKQSKFIFKLETAKKFHTHQGAIAHDDLIGHKLGAQIASHTGHAFDLLAPSIDDLIRDIKRNSQIIFPKDIGFILMKMAITPGKTVLECGTGSGGLTSVLALMVGPNGKVHTYDQREDMQTLARKNIERIGLQDRVTFKLRDIAEGFDEVEADAVFLDVPRPWEYTAQAHRALSGGGFLGSLVPTTNQVSNLIAALERDHFSFIEVCEVLVRYYKPVAERLRPTDRMVAHTGFLIFARAISGLTAEPETPEPAGDGVDLGAIDDGLERGETQL
jgi:tRNA (adenine57-N1/adenine58-N1)-methyltransferase